ncbi:hypothetical protein GCM10028824_12200 [Hymenobacter segetis]
MATRETNEGMVQILDAVRENGFYGCKIRIILDDEEITMKFGTNEKGFMQLKKLLSFQPFESVEAGKYQYFYAGVYWETGTQELARIRIEQAKRHKQFEVELPKELGANLQWFKIAKDKSQLAHLIVFE